MYLRFARPRTPEALPSGAARRPSRRDAAQARRSATFAVRRPSAEACRPLARLRDTKAAFAVHENAFAPRMLHESNKNCCRAFPLSFLLTTCCSTLMRQRSYASDGSLGEAEPERCESIRANAPCNCQDGRPHSFVKPAKRAFSCAAKAAFVSGTRGGDDSRDATRRTWRDEVSGHDATRRIKVAQQPASTRPIFVVARSAKHPRIDYAETIASVNLVAPCCNGVSTVATAGINPRA